MITPKSIHHSSKTSRGSRLVKPVRLTGRYRVLSLLLVLAVAVSGGIYLTFKSRAAAVTYPLKVSANQRNLTDQNGQPYFLNVDTAWTFLSHIPDRAEADAYLDARKAQGYNSVMSFIGGFQAKTVMKGGVPMFTDGDYNKPNDAYFATVDQLVRDAADRGLQIVMGPLNLSNQQIGSPGGLPTAAQLANLGTYVGNRYKTFDNIIWFMDGDYDASNIDAMARAIKAADHRHLMTYYPAVDSYELGAKSWLDLYAFRENRADSPPYSYMRVKGYYEYAPTKPVIDLEPAYETGDAVTGVATTPYMVRRNAWWAWLQGAMGVTYGGNRATWFVGENGPNKWQPYIGIGGDRQTGLMTGLLSGYNWHNLVPDSAHTLVTAGYGVYGGKDYVTAGLSPDGNLAMAYLPTSRTITLDMTKFSTPVQGYWYDPSSGVVTGVGNGFVNSGSKTFTTPGKNAAGDTDWVLVLTTGSR